MFIELFINREGRTLRHQVTAAAAADGAPTWLEKDPVTLAENSLHYVLESTDAAIGPYFRGFSGLELRQGKNAAGQLVAISLIHSSETNKALRVLIKAADGTFDSAEVLQ